MLKTNPEHLRLTTGRLFWLPPDETGWIDFGNCTSHQEQPDVQRLDHWRYAGGTKRVDHSLVKSLKPVRVFKFDEHFAETIALMALAAAATEVTQAAAVDVEVSITPDPALAPGQSLFLGKQNISNLVALEDTMPVVEGVDYKVNYGAGIVTLLKLSSDQWDFTFDCAEVKTLNFEMFSKLLTEGTFRFLETDQHDSVPVGDSTIEGTAYVTAWGETNTEAFQEYTVEVLSIE
jgi:hypothetical protein